MGGPQLREENLVEKRPPSLGGSFLSFEKLFGVCVFFWGGGFQKALLLAKSTFYKNKSLPGRAHLEIRIRHYSYITVIS